MSLGDFNHAPRRLFSYDPIHTEQQNNSAAIISNSMISGNSASQEMIGSNDQRFCVSTALAVE